MPAFRLGIVGTVVLSTVAIAHAQAPIGQGVSREDFAKVKSLDEAVEVIRERFKQDERPALAFLISADKVREAVRVALKSYEAGLDRQETKHPGAKKYFLEVVKPACLRVAEHGEWSPKFSFFSFYTLSERGTEYDGLGLRLRIDTPEADAKAFALPIVDLYYGRFTP